MFQGDDQHSRRKGIGYDIEATRRGVDPLKYKMIFVH